MADETTLHEEAMVLASEIAALSERFARLESDRAAAGVPPLESLAALVQSTSTTLGVLQRVVTGEEAIKLRSDHEALKREVGRFETALAEIDRRAEAGDEEVKREAQELRARLESFKEWADKCELALQEQSKQLAALPAVIKGADGRGFNPRGKYEAGAVYQRLDIAEIGGSSYISAEDGNTEKPSPRSPRWKLLAKRGGGGAGQSDLAGLSNGLLRLANGNLGINTDNALTPLHIRTTSLGVVLSHLAESDPSGYLAIEDTNARIALFSANEGSHGSTLSLAEVNSGVFENQWSIGRATSSAGSKLEFAFGTSTNYAENGTKVSFDTDGIVTAGGFLTTNNTTCGNVLLNQSSAATASDLNFRVGSNNRWILERSGAESGANAGGDLTLYRYNDDGTFLGTVLNFVRSTGQSQFVNSAEATTAGAGAVKVTGGIYAAKKIITASTITTALSSEWDFGAAASVSPTSPNRTIRIKVGGVDYYLHAKTTND